MNDINIPLTADDMAQLQGGATLTLHPYWQQLPVSVAAKHYTHARFSQLFYYGTPTDLACSQLLQNSIDIVVCGETSLLRSLSLLIPPATPVVLYGNVSNIYHDMLTDWIAYAQVRNVSIESAFLHDTTGARICYNADQNRPLTNPTSPDFATWIVDYCKRYLAANKRANGLFVDNSVGAPPATSTKPVEDVSNYATSYASILGQLTALGLVIPNTGGANVAAIDLMVAACGWWYEEFMLRPLSHNWKRFEDTAAIVAGRQAAHGAKAILDSHPQDGDSSDPRTQLATLAYYYLLADPDRTYLDFYGGFAPGTTWNQHWCAAAAVDIGTPNGSWTLYMTGLDPADNGATYRIYRRNFTKATVFYRPLSFKDWTTKPDLSDKSSITVSFAAGIKPLAADGTTGPIHGYITLRNGEGAIMML